jgi:hypothetical protein
MLNILTRWLRGLFAGHARPSSPTAPIPTPPSTSVALPVKRYKRLSIPLYLGTGDPPPAHWKQCAPSAIKRFKAELTCPLGHGMTLKGHTVDARGLVSPSVVCHVPACSFHEFVVLEGWANGDVR